jgi:hypothetical protein
MAAKPRKSVVQNIIKNLLEMEIPEIQTASKELGEWIKQLEQHSFKLQHYATEIENWASEEEEVDSIELTDLIKDLEATLTDMRKGRTPGISAPDDESGPIDSPEKMLRGYGIAGRVIKEPKALPKAEIRVSEEKGQGKPATSSKIPVEEIKKDQPRTPQGILIARDGEKPKVKAELPTGDKEVVTRESEKRTQEEDEARGYITPEGFLIRRLRP